MKQFHKILKWGVIGDGIMAQDFCQTVHDNTEGTHKIVAIGSVSLPKVEVLAHKFGIKKVYSDHKQVAQDDDVDAVYVAVMNTRHREMVNFCIVNKKAVLCDQPLGVSLEETISMIEAARQHRCFLMESLKPRFYPIFLDMFEEITSGQIGRLRGIKISLGQRSVKKEIMSNPELGGGVLHEFGGYALWIVHWIFQNQEPTRYIASAKFSERGVDIDLRLKLRFPFDRFAEIHLSAIEELDNRAAIIGTNGNMLVPDLFEPTRLIIGTKVVARPIMCEAKETNCSGTFYSLIFQMEEVLDSLQNGDFESKVMDHEQSLKIARWRQEIRSLITSE